MLYQVGDSRHTQNIQINKVIGENEKSVFYIMGKKTKWTFWPNICIYSVRPRNIVITLQH